VVEHPVAPRLRALIRDVPDFPKPGILFKDLTPVFADGGAQRALCQALADRYRGRGVDAFVGIEARGFVVGAPLAVELGAGLVLVRKPGKLPARTVSRAYALEYGQGTLEMHHDAVRPGMRVVVVDDLLATGGTAAAAVAMLREAGAEVLEAAFVVELAFLDGRRRLDADAFALVTY
jgi:adenine phosphoribosyltransferase